ncbi:hypothetical protein ACWIID_13785 [Streptomyces phaeochromogenes]
MATSASGKVPATRAVSTPESTSPINSASSTPSPTTSTVPTRTPAQTQARLKDWAELHIEEVNEARERYDTSES